MDDNFDIQLYSLDHLGENATSPVEVKPANPNQPRDRTAEEEQLRNLVLKAAEGNLDYLNFTYLEDRRARAGYRSAGELEIVNRYCSAARESADRDPRAKEILGDALRSCARNQAELPGRGVSSMRYGTQPTQCGVAFDRPQAALLTEVVLKNHKEFYPLWEQYLALHEGAHCTPENARGRFMGPVDEAKLPPEERQSLAEYGELHADAYALFTIVRDSMRGGWFDSIVPEVFKVANKSYKDMAAFSFAQYRHRTMWFDAFAANLKNFDREKIGNLSDEDISSLAIKYTDQAMEKIAGRDKTRATDFKAFRSISF